MHLEGPLRLGKQTVTNADPAPFIKLAETPGGDATSSMQTSAEIAIHYRIKYTVYSYDECSVNRLYVYICLILTLK